MNESRRREEAERSATRMRQGIRERERERERRTTDERKSEQLVCVWKLEGRINWGLIPAMKVFSKNTLP